MMTGTDSTSMYKAWLEGQGFSRQTIRDRVKFHDARLREWDTWDVPRDQIANYLAGYAGWSRRTYHNHFASIYGWLVECHGWHTNPMDGIRKVPAPKPRPKPLSEADLRRALTTAAPRTRSFLMLGYLAGLRAHEIAKFHGRDVDETGLYVLGKGGQGSMLPTHSLLWDLAQRYPRDGFWFPSQSGAAHVGAGTVTDQVGRHFRSLGLEGASHRARHTFGTTLLRGGANLRVVQELMRHASLSTTALYLGVDEDEKRSAIAGLVA